MSIEPIGFIVLLLGLLSMVNGARFAITTLCLSTLLGAAAALQLPALGGSSIHPSHLLVLFLVVAALLRPAQTQATLASMAYPGPGFWFAAYILFSVASSFFLPRIFAGATLVYSSARDTTGMMSTVAAPLSPGSSNLSQSVYLLGDLACFAVVSGLARLGYARFIALQLIVASIACFTLALIDIGTFLTDQSYLLDVIRNANYTMHTAETISGFKRIVGPFPEASTYGAVALAYFSFTLLLWLERVQSRMAGLATLFIGPTIVLCTSTTAYIAGIFVVCMFVLFCLKRLISGPAKTPHVTFLVITLFLIPCAIVALSLVPDAWNSIAGLMSTTLSDKLQSQSGEERTAWNTLALIAFADIAAEATCAMDAITAAFPIACVSRSPDMCRPEALARLYRKAAKRRVPVNPTLESNAAIKLEARTVPSPAPKVAVSTNAINASVFQAVRSSPDCDWSLSGRLISIALALLVFSGVTGWSVAH
ncbi:hypothetical protein ACCS78_27635, partial [Rhizobium johnstonii]